MNKEKQKVFYLGFFKTGTTSFGYFLRKLGYRSMSNYRPFSATFVEGLRRKEYSELFEVVDQYDVFDDFPWFLYYKEFEKRYPSAKFVFYERELVSWRKSCVQYFGRTSSPMFELIFGVGKGSPAYNKNHHEQVYREHSKSVRAYFKSKPEKYLEIFNFSDKTAADVAAFLDVSWSGEVFPVYNVNRSTYLLRMWVYAKLKIAAFLRIPERFISKE